MVWGWGGDSLFSTEKPVVTSTVQLALSGAGYRVEEAADLETAIAGSKLDMFPRKEKENKPIRRQHRKQTLPVGS